MNPASVTPHRNTKRPRRLAWPRTSPFHGGNTGSNPVGDANNPKHLSQSYLYSSFGRGCCGDDRTGTFPVFRPFQGLRGSRKSGVQEPHGVQKKGWAEVLISCSHSQILVTRMSA